MKDLTPEASMPGDDEAPPQEEEGEEEDPVRQITRQSLPEDGYEWKKYGQKFIKTIAKYRAYFRCQNTTCSAKKRAEWPASGPGRGELRVVYEGLHNHDSHSIAATSSSTEVSAPASANQYDLLTQVYRSQGQ